MAMSDIELHKVTRAGTSALTVFLPGPMVKRTTRVLEGVPGICPNGEHGALQPRKTVSVHRLSYDRLVRILGQALDESSSDLARRELPTAGANGRRS
jgi:hypothetical protein